MVKNKRKSGNKFEFSEENLRKLIIDEVIPKNPGVTFEIKPSLSTESIYLKLERDGASRSLRFSNHKAKNNITTKRNDSNGRRELINIIQNKIDKINLEIRFRLLNNLDKK